MVITNTDNSRRQPFMPEVFVLKPQQRALKCGVTEPRKERTLSLLPLFCTRLSPSLTTLLSFSLSQHAICGLWSQCPWACHLLELAGSNKSVRKKIEPWPNIFIFFIVIPLSDHLTRWISLPVYVFFFFFFYPETCFNDLNNLVLVNIEGKKCKLIHSVIHLVTTLQHGSWAYWVQG